MLTTEELDPAGYGRIVRDGDGSVDRHRGDEEPGRASPRRSWPSARSTSAPTPSTAGALLSALDVVAAQGGERYLTGAFQVMRDRGEHVATHLTDDAERRPRRQRPGRPDGGRAVAQTRILEACAARGGHLPPARHHPRGGRRRDRRGHGDRAGRDASGPDRRGRRREVGPHTTLTDSRIGDGAQRACTPTWSRRDVGEDASVGPFAYLRPGTVIARGGEDRHLRGGQELGCRRGRQGAAPVLHRGRRRGRGQQPRRRARSPPTTTAAASTARASDQSVKTGIHTSLVAPVDVGDEAYTGAGSVITGDVPEGALGIARAKQRNVEGYAERDGREGRAGSEQAPWTPSPRRRPARASPPATTSG